MSKYIDVRGPWPILFDDLRAYVLVGASRSITIEQAQNLITQDACEHGYTYGCKACNPDGPEDDYREDR